MDWFLDHESSIRLVSFGVGLAFFMAIGLALPFRQIPTTSLLPRWSRNLAFIIGNSLLLRLVAPLSLVSAALITESKGWGLLNWLHFPTPIELVLSLVLLDACIYWQHRIFHLVPFFWRFHRLHHTDIEFDVTTAGRFHPAEILFSYGLKLLIVLSLGIGAVAIIIYEVVLNFFALFNHSNFSFPSKIEPGIRALFVTPSMHRIHHSTEPKETNSNYGNFLSCWDRLFSSYTKESDEDPRTMAIGLTEFRAPEDQRLLSMLSQPFKSGRR